MEDNFIEVQLGFYISGLSITGFRLLEEQIILYAETPDLNGIKIQFNSPYYKNIYDYLKNLVSGMPEPECYQT